MDIEERISDTPSSISAVWPPIEVSNGRVKGFYDQFLDTPAATDEFIDRFREYEEQVRTHTDNDRLVIRALGRSSTLTQLDSAGLQLEGALPVRDDVLVAYVASNAPSRQVSMGDLQKHGQALAEVADQSRETDTSTCHLRDLGLEPYIIGAATSRQAKLEKAERFNELYGAFGYEEDEVVELLLNPANTIAYVEDEFGVVSTVMAERATVAVEGYGDVKIAEITEAITRTADRGRGLYRAISGFLVDQLVDSAEDDIDVIYGESNLAMRSVLIAAHQNGRRFSYFDREKLGVARPSFGILQQNFHVEDGTETRPYNDFALSYVPLIKD